jgi:hypothetical protein
LRPSDSYLGRVTLYKTQKKKKKKKKKKKPKKPGGGEICMKVYAVNKVVCSSMIIAFADEKLIFGVP